MKVYHIRWQQLEDDGKYHYHYLRGVTITSGRTGYATTRIPALALAVPEEIAEWICVKLEIQDDLNPEMVNIQEGNADEM